MTVVALPFGVPAILNTFTVVAFLAAELPSRSLAPDAYRALLAHDWPGNVRELEHALAHAVALASGDRIVLDDLPPALSRTERAFLQDALARHRGNISRAADEMGMYRQHLQQKLAEYDIDAETFRRG